MLVVGNFLDSLLKDYSLPLHSPTISPLVMSIPKHHLGETTSKQSLFFCSSSCDVKYLLYILEIFGYIPETYQILRCQMTTSEEELDLFLKRAQIHPNHYLILDINKLSFKLQEVSTIFTFFHMISCVLFKKSLCMVNSCTHSLFHTIYHLLIGTIKIFS